MISLVFFFLLKPAYISYWESSQMSVCLTSSSVNFFTYFEAQLLRVCKLRLVLYSFWSDPIIMKSTLFDIDIVWPSFLLLVLAWCLSPFFTLKLSLFLYLMCSFWKTVYSFLFFSLTIFFFWLYYLVYLLINWLLLYLVLKLPSYSLFPICPIQFYFLLSSLD